MSDIDGSPDDRDAPRRFKRPRRQRLTIAVSGCVMAGVAAAGVFAAGGLSWLDDDPADVEPGDSADVEYGVDEGLCDVFDVALYEDVVGKAPRVTEDASNSTQVPAMLYCRLSANPDDASKPAHALDIRVWTHASAAAAQADFDDSLGVANSDVESMTAVEGPWDQAAAETLDNVEQHLLLVQDDNLTVAIIQAVRPFHALDEDSATRLATTYAEQVTTQLKL